MKFSTQSGILIAEVPVKDFRVVMVDCKKKNIGRANIANAGYFTAVPEGYTFPVTHCVADFAGGANLKAHLQRCGTVKNGKAIFDTGGGANAQFGGKAVSTLYVKDGKAHIAELAALPSGVDYALGGVPIMRGGADVKFATFVRGQGWTGGELRATWHVFVGLMADPATTIYVMGMKTTSSNCVLSAEAYMAFKRLGFRDVIKLDGGGSYYFNANGTTSSTLENRRVNTIIEFGEKNAAATMTSNPYRTPTVALRKGSSGEGVKWMQWALASKGYLCSVDGSFGPATDAQLCAFQKASGLTADGSCGPATRAELSK